jgi:hypothetical protein
MFSVPSASSAAGQVSLTGSSGGSQGSRPRARLEFVSSPRAKVITESPVPATAWGTIHCKPSRRRASARSQREEEWKVYRRGGPSSAGQRIDGNMDVPRGTGLSAFERHGVVGRQAIEDGPRKPWVPVLPGSVRERGLRRLKPGATRGPVVERDVGTCASPKLCASFCRAVVATSPCQAL